MNPKYDAKTADFIKELQKEEFTDEQIDFIMAHSVAMVKCALIDAQNETNNSVHKVMSYL